MQAVSRFFAKSEKYSKSIEITVKSTNIIKCIKKSIDESRFVVIIKT
jgi:hypothetical protein